MIARQTSAIDLARPFWQHADLFPPGECCFLLDSALPSRQLGTKSYLGGHPSALLTGKRISNPQQWPAQWSRDHRPGVLPFEMRLVIWTQADGHIPEVPEIRTWAGDPFQAMRELNKEFFPDQKTDPGSECFTSGLVGYFGYELAHSIEDLPDTGMDNPDVPDLAFMVADVVLGHDHQTQETTLATTGRGLDQATAQKNAGDLSTYWQALLSSPVQKKLEKKSGPVQMEGDFDRQRYSAAVQQCREHILAGDVFEICLTHRLETDFKGDPWPLYCRLREINPAPFSSWLQFPRFQVISASPERFLKLDHRGMAESRPIKGTRPRGDTPARDAQLKSDLAKSEKDRAENLMIVDLVRNDLGKVAEIGSVQVPELMKVESYATVFQLVSTVQAKLRAEFDAIDLVRACYPGGSMTGAPKIEAMKIIDSLETVKRGVFSGAIGYLDQSGIMDLSIVIRTIVCQGGKAHFGVGGAVTIDSDPDAEYQETMDKARALILALGGTPEGAPQKPTT